jgi:SAM-dependent methyltransferase
MSDPRTALVGAGYDAMAETWAAWSSRVASDPRRDWLADLIALLPADGRVLELGCGNGTSETHELAESFRLTGVDLSCEQLRRARARIPNAEFVHGDIVSIEFEPASFDGVCAFYVLNHVPRELLPKLFSRVLTWLKPGGVFLASLGTGDESNWQGEWLGVPMYFSSFPAETNTRLIAEAGFTLVRDELVTIDEPEASVEFQWILAKR